MKSYFAVKFSENEPVQRFTLLQDAKAAATNWLRDWLRAKASQPAGAVIKAQACLRDNVLHIQYRVDGSDGYQTHDVQVDHPDVIAQTLAMAPTKPSMAGTDTPYAVMAVTPFKEGVAAFSIGSFVLAVVEVKTPTKNDESYIDEITDDDSYKVIGMSLFDDDGNESEHVEIASCDVEDALLDEIASGSTSGPAMQFIRSLKG